jgi:hypothetical protein
MPHPDRHLDIVLLHAGRHAGPSPRLSDIPQLRTNQLGQPLAFNNRPSREPREDSWWKHIEPNQIVIKRQSNRNKEDDIRDGDAGEYRYPRYGQRCWQPEIVKLVKPFLDSPDIRISGKIHC